MRETNTNVFKFGYLPCHRIKNIFHNISNFFRTLKWAWQRAVNGYCVFDLYDLDVYHTNMMVKALRDFAKYTQSFPNDMSYDEWIKILNEMADCFEQSIEDTDFDTPEYQEWRRLSEKYKTTTEKDGTVTISIPDDIPELNEASKRWLSVIQEDTRKREEMKTRALTLLKEYYEDLWW